MVIENKRKETPFAVRDNMLDIWKHATELSMRGFGIKKRKFPKTPKNFDVWTEESQEKWKIQQQEYLERQTLWDKIFVRNESQVMDDLCRKIVYAIDKANNLNPQYICECDQERLLQDEAIGLCNNLERELNHIAETIPSNKNYLVQMAADIEKEIALIRGWRKKCNETRKKVIENEINRRKTVADKINFILDNELLKQVKQEETE